MSQQPQDRRWEVDLLADEFGEPLHERFEEDVHKSQAEAAVILLRLGGAVQSYVIRQQDPETGLWFPVKAVFKWQSFVPGIRAPRQVPQQPPAAEPEVDLEPETDFEDLTGAGYADEPELSDEDDDEVEGQWYVKGDQRVLAMSAAEQQVLLRDGFKPEPQD